MAKSIEASQKEIEEHESLTKALGLKDLDVVKQEWDEQGQRLLLYCVPSWGVGLCPQCGHLSTDIHDYPEQRQIDDAPLRGQKTQLVFDVHRLRCEVCKCVFTLRLRDVVADCSYTYRLAELIADPSRKQDVQTLSRVYGLGYKVVESIVQKAAEAKLKERQKQPIQVKQLGIDEQSNRKGHGNFVLVLTDLERRIVVDILPDREKASLIQWLREPPAGIDLSQVHSVATDLWSHYRDAVSEVFADRVAVVADRFHVMQNLHQAIHKTRRLAQQQATSEEEKKQLKGLRYLLLKKDDNLTAKARQRLQLLETSHPDLYAITRLRQRLFEWYEMPLTPNNAKEGLNTWLADAAQLQDKALDSFCNTLRNWQPEILNFFRTASPVALLKV